MARKGTCEALRALKNRGSKLGTNTITEAEIPGWLCEAGVADRFHTVILSFDFPAEALASHCVAHMWNLAHYRRALRPGVREMLDGLQSMGLKLGIISNTAALYQAIDSLEAYGIRDFLQDVTLSSVTGMRKPAPGIFHAALRQLRSELQECVYVGNTVSRDVIGSKRAGLAAAVQIRSHLTKEKDRGVSREYAPDCKAAVIRIQQDRQTIKATS